MKIITGVELDELLDSCSLRFNQHLKDFSEKIYPENSGKYMLIIDIPSDDICYVLEKEISKNIFSKSYLEFEKLGGQNISEFIYIPTKEFINKLVQFVSNDESFNPEILAETVGLKGNILITQINELFLKKNIFDSALKKLVYRIENKFNTQVNTFGIVEKNSSLYSILSKNKSNANYLGYIVVPVDEDEEYLVTKNSKEDYDLSDFMDMFLAQNSIVETQTLIEFISKEFQCKVFANTIKYKQDAPTEQNILPNMKENEVFLYLHYFLD
jgi:hypothetical protein